MSSNTKRDAPKRPYSHLVVDPPEKVKIVRTLKMMLDHEKGLGNAELLNLKENMAKMQELIEDKINDQEQKLDVRVSEVFNESKLLGRIMDFVGVRDLANCRLVNRKFQVAASEKIKTRRILKLTSFQYKQSVAELTATGFIRSIPGFPRRHPLFPFHKFDIAMGLYSTLMVQFLDIYAPLITYLHLQYDATRSNGIPCNFAKDFKKVMTFSRLQNCTHLAISDFPIFTTGSGVLEKFLDPIPSHSQVKILKYTLEYTGTKANYLSDASYYGKLLKSCTALESFVVHIKYNCNVESGDIMQNLIEAINQADLKNLKNLSLQWEDKRNRNKKQVIAKVDFPQLLPAVFELKSFKLVNVSCATLLPFLKHHSKTLEVLKIHFSAKSEIIDVKINHLLELQLPLLNKLQLPGCLSEEETKQMMNLITQEHFPKVSCIKITESGSNLRKSVPDFTANVTRLKLELDNTSPHTYQSLLEFVEAFPLVFDLSLKNAGQHILRNIWKTSLRFSLTEFSMNSATKTSYSANDTFELDSILTGFSVPYCKKLVLKEINTKVFFDLDSFDVDKWKFQWRFLEGQILGEHNSIACFENLRSLKISYPRGHITEVSMIYIVKNLNRLTSLTIEHSSIRQYFVAAIRDSLGSPFYLDVDCVDST